MAKKKSDANDMGGVEEHLTIAEIVKRFKPGFEQFARYGGQGDWNLEPLIREILEQGFRSELGMIEAVDDGEILDGNRRASALVEAAKRSPALGKLKFPVRVYPSTLTRDQRDNLRFRAARGTKGWTRGDFIHAMVSLIETYPGQITEHELARKVGLERILEQFPRAVKRNEDGSLATDQEGRPIFQNRQGVFQDARRLARLPRAVQEAFCRGVDGKGPAIPSRSLTSLVGHWEKDLESDGDLRRLQSVADVDELLDKLPEDSALFQELKPLLKSTTAAGRGAGKGAMGIKDLEQTATALAASMPFVHVVSYVSRAPGYASEDMLRALIALGGRVQAICDQDAEASRLLAGVSALVKRDKPKKETEAA